MMMYPASRSYYSEALTPLCTTALLPFLLWLFKLCKKTERYTPNNVPVIKLKECTTKWHKAMEKCPKTDLKYLVIGGGFLGSRIIKGLLALGEKYIKVFDFSSKVELEWATDEHVEFIHGDI